MAKFKMGPTVPVDGVITARLTAADGTTALVDADVGKFVSLSAESEMSMCAVTGKIDGVVVSLSEGTQDGFKLGSVQVEGRVNAICDGLEATPGTGSIAVGDYVVCGTPVAAGTALTLTTGPKVCKATNQPDEAVVSTLAGADTAAAVKVVLDAALVTQADANNNLLHAWKVVSLGNAGAVGDTCVIERVC